MNRLGLALPVASLLLPAIADAQEADRSTSLFDGFEKRQTAAYFVSATSTMETRFGRLEFDGGGFPTPDTAQ
ncbi:hypothetical protein CLV78_1011032 [Aliiruegeria haliotis]|uniref:Uncharacterized protein n=1 Tax=Aliiruegeria haliotis TaxID=1280846 RepID=A0A2T0S0G6_9RHOB|nr:hypothetical protein [Aliiruegeria haliotis]PRY26927.1 hypothetical protein CLV78_1011032 [Aliiruegeria haliotis]